MKLLEHPPLVIKTVFEPSELLVDFRTYGNERVVWLRFPDGAGQVLAAPYLDDPDALARLIRDWVRSVINATVAQVTTQTKASDK